MTEELKQQLLFLAQKYETEDFVKNDPSFVLKRFCDPKETECAALIAAVLSFGRREQFIKKIEYILCLAQKSGNLFNWLKNRDFQNTFVPKEITNTETKFYRFYSYKDLLLFFERIAQILNDSETLGDFFRQKYLASSKNEPLCTIISNEFSECAIVPKGKTCANKRINMFLRWMVRKNSPVDTGFWEWYSPKDLIMPLDTHVLTQAKNLMLIPQKSSGTLKTAILLTEELKKIWRDDPTKGDFALFGLGINEKN